MPQKIDTLSPDLSELAPHLKKEKQILLFTGKNSYTTSGAEEALSPLLSKIHVHHLQAPTGRPEINGLKKILLQIKSTPLPSLWLTIGGGAVIDYAKLIQAFWGTEEKKETLNPIVIKHLVIPTTAGSGSESTPFAVLFDGATKHSVEHPQLLALYVFLAPQFVARASAKVSASSGLDALCQAIESLWSIHSTDSSRKLARKSLALSWKNIAPAVLEKNPSAIAQMSQAANLAGQAIAITRTTAAHALSYPLTACFSIPHGHAVALILPLILDYNAKVTASDCADPRGIAFVQERIVEICTLLNAENPQQAKALFLQKIKQLGLPSKLSELGITTAEEYEKILSHGFTPERVKNNPRQLSQKEASDFLKER